jgi:hypothetical protein
MTLFVMGAADLPWVIRSLQGDAKKRGLRVQACGTSRAMSAPKPLERPAVATDDGSGPRMVESSGDWGAIDAHFSSVPRGTMTDREREVFAEHRRKLEANMPMLTTEQRRASRRHA